MEGDPYRTKLGALGARTHGVGASRSGINPFTELRTVLALVRLLRRLRPDVSLAYFAKPVIYTSIAGVLARVPARYALIAGLGHAFSDDESVRKARRRALNVLVRWLYRISLRRNRLVFFQNPNDLREFVDADLVSVNAAVRVNGTGVDLSYYDFSEPASEPVTFVLAARLIAEKGIREYVAATRLLRQRDRSVRCILLGGLDDNPSAITADEVADWVSGGVVEWPGAVEDVRPWLEASSVYVLPTWYREGVPRSTQEAMAVGRAIITTDMPGCRETVDHGRNGLLVKPRDPEALAGAMEYFLQNTDAITAMGRESRKLAEQRFDVRRINRQMLAAMGLVPPDDGA